MKAKMMRNVELVSLAIDEAGFASLRIRDRDTGDVYTVPGGYVPLVEGGLPTADVRFELYRTGEAWRGRSGAMTDLVQEGAEWFDPSYLQVDIRVVAGGRELSINLADDLGTADRKLWNQGTLQLFDRTVSYMRDKIAGSHATGLCANREPHEPHDHYSKTLGTFWCTADQGQREPNRSQREQDRRNDR